MLTVDADAGLSTAVAVRRLRRHGLNQLRETRPPSAATILFNQLKSVIVGLLAAAAAVSLLFGDWVEGGAIVAVLVINTLLGFVAELRAVRSMAALRQLGSVRARVRRDGEVDEIPATALVPGDVVVLEAGDVVTADLRLLEASKLQADESVLTGESLPAGKSVNVVPADTPVAARRNMLFKGTSVTRGSAEAVVVLTGMETELGRIARLVSEAKGEMTPLERRLARLGNRLVWVSLAIAAATTLAGVLAHRPWVLMIETGIALAVAAIPEGLPIVATIALARGMWRMARRNVLTNRLSAVETLGATSIVLTDKTGTLTENRLTLKRLELDGGPVDLAGEGLQLAGVLSRHGERLADPLQHPDVRAALEAGVLCNNAALDRDDPSSPPGEAQGIGDPLEVALLVAGAKAGLDDMAMENALPEMQEEAFDPATKMMATVHADAARADHRVAVKGAPEMVLARSVALLGANGQTRPMDATTRKQWLARSEELAADGLRLLALAEKRTSEAPPDPYADLVFIGLAALLDPPRADVRDAIAATRAAGVQVVMATGDQAATARNIAAAVGLAGEDAQVVTGRDLAACLDRGEPLGAELLQAPIYARVTPEQKLRLVEAHQRAGAVVAMTGDGINDAPALKKADIGVAMGRRGTQVAREAADMVLQDDSLSSIVAAIEQGRIIFGNIRKFVLYLLSCNLSEVMVVAVAAAAGLPLPLLPLQILFLNLVTDVFPALALAMGEGEPNVMLRPPRDAREGLLTRGHWLAMCAWSVTISSAVLGVLVYSLRVLQRPEVEATTWSFLTLGLAQLWHVLNVRDPESRLLSNEVSGNRFVGGALALCALLFGAALYVPGLARLLRLVPPDAQGWALILSASLMPLLVGQLALMLGVGRGVRKRGPALSPDAASPPGSATRR